MLCDQNKNKIQKHHFTLNIKKKSTSRYKFFKSLMDCGLLHVMCFIYICYNKKNNNFHTTQIYEMLFLFLNIQIYTTLTKFKTKSWIRATVKWNKFATRWRNKKKCTSLWNSGEMNFHLLSSVIYSSLQLVHIFFSNFCISLIFRTI